VIIQGVPFPRHLHRVLGAQALEAHGLVPLV